MLSLCTNNGLPAECSPCVQTTDPLEVVLSLLDVLTDGLQVADLLEVQGTQDLQQLHLPCNKHYLYRALKASVTG